MVKFLTLELDGKFDTGFKAKLEIRPDLNSRPQTVVKAQLPANVELLNIYRQWQRHYSELEGFFKALKDNYPEQITNSSQQELAFQNCQEKAKLFEHSLNIWLNNSPEFEPIKTAILRSGNNFRLWLQTDNIWLQRLPWEKWQILQNTSADIAIIVSEYDTLARQLKNHEKIRILAILGYATDLKSLEEDRKILDDIAGKAGAEIIWEKAPTPHELNQLLRQETWNILFFSGHSASTEDGQDCEIQLTQTHKLKIADFRFSLGEATKNGLKLAIFNSCDGIGLAQQLSREKGMALPHLIFMREKLPDPISPKFLQYFLTAFTNNKSLYAAVHEAQKNLHDDWEKDYPCASWLPVVCPNPTEEPPAWNNLCNSTQKKQNWQRFFLTLGLGLAVTTAVVGGREMGILEPLELTTYDRMMQLRTKEPPDERLFIITIDQKDWDYQDQMGMKRPLIPGSDRKRSLSGEALSQLLSKLQPYQPSVIALDILRPIAATEDYPALGNQLQNTRNFLAICRFNNYQQQDGVAAPPELPKNQVGFSNVVFDRDTAADASVNKVRRYLYQAKLDDKSPCLSPASLPSKSQISCNFQDYAPSFSLLIAKRYLESQNRDFDCHKLDRGILEINIGDTRISDWLQSANGPYKTQKTETQSGRQVMLNYRRMADNDIEAITKIAPKKSLRQVLDPSFNPESVREKIVLIGVTEPGIDDFLTPFSRNSSAVIPGVYLHAHAVSQVLDTMLGKRTSIAFWNPVQEGFWVLGWSLIGGILAGRFLRVKSILIAGAIAIITLGGIGWILFNYGGLWVPLIPPAIALVTTTGIFFFLRPYFLKF
jgi:CHASE2 domain-containing sensor protein